ncbi:MAG: FG-GAP-like repeat-containing protein [Pyrinomonadaceae bacterium]
MKVLFVIVFILMSASPPDVDAQKVRLRSHITPNCSVVSGSSQLKFTDIYADGRIAVQGSYNCRGVFIYDISDPDAPVLASVYNPSPNQAFLEAIVIGNLGFFGSGGPSPVGPAAAGDGVHIVDLTDPYKPVLLSKVNGSTGNGFNTVHEIVVHGNYLIENYNSVAIKTLKIIDIADPSHPFHKWDFIPQDSLWVHAVHVRGNRMYTSGWTGRIEIYDISDLAQKPPTLLGSILGDMSNHSSWTSEDGNYLYSCRETTDGDLRVYDVRDATRPTLVRTIKTTELGINAVSPHNPVVLGKSLYISWYQAGVQVFDLTDPTFPKRVGQYDTFPAAFAPPAPGDQLQLAAEPWDMICGTTNFQNSIPTSYDGNWAVFPLLGHDKVLAGDMENGLFVLDASALTSPPRNRVSDFDGDRKTDVSIFGKNGWQVESSSTRSTDFTWFGLPTDIIVPGDYDGNGRTEIAVFRPSSGQWFYQIGNSYRAVQWGQEGDIPVPADYDADGRTDIAVWRRSTGVWYVLQSTLGMKANQWGGSSDKPLTGDFDADGKADLVVWRPANGVWYILQSSSSLPLYMQWGTQGDKPVSADFDGNGVTDFAVYRPHNGIWYIYDPAAIPTERGFKWGTADDVPIPADYDGDSKADPAVFRPDTHEWYWINSSDGSFGTRSFGQTGDRPSPSSVQPQ